MNAFRITKLNTIFRILFICSICVFSANAQRPAATPANEPAPDRISFGLRGGVLFSGLVNNADSTQATSATSPPTISTTTVNSQSWRGAIGGTIRYDLTEKIDIGADVLFRRAGYDTAINLYTQDDGEIDDLIEGRTEQTKADFWDVPILARYYTKARSDEGSRPFFTGGIAFRSAGNIRSISEVIDEDLLRDTDTTPVGPAHDFSSGAVIGAGIQLRDDVGLKVDFEVRLTRWFQRSLMSGPANSRQNQAEFVFGMTF
jgi:hypothetical protein